MRATPACMNCGRMDWMYLIGSANSDSVGRNVGAGGMLCRSLRKSVCCSCVSVGTGSSSNEAACARRL